VPRANRHYVPGLIWHITHRCHKREYLLKFNRDRRTWIHWLFESKRRFDLRILNYAVTSNHIHLLVWDTGKLPTIAKSMDLIAGRSAQEFNKRKERHGAYWEDRYHATAIENDSHLIRCMVYIDLNMVRAGVIKHPVEWPFCGYREIIGRRRRFTLIHRPSVLNLLKLETEEKLREIYPKWIQNTLELGTTRRESIWTENVAVGTEEFVKRTAKALGIKSVGKKITCFDEKSSTWQLREEWGSYELLFGP
jgi:putative transposase